jgi:MFS family permease
MQWIVDALQTWLTRPLLLTGGALGDLYGRRRVFACGIGSSPGSVICARRRGTA